MLLNVLSLDFIVVIDMIMLRWLALRRDVYRFIFVLFVLQLLQRRNALHEKAARRRRVLEESYKNQMFERDYDETKIWINEKLKAASDYEGYLVRL